MNQFAEWLVKQTPVFDQMIIDDIRPYDGWISNIVTGNVIPEWWTIREIVRKIAEGNAFRPSKPTSPPKIRWNHVYVSPDDLIPVDV